MRTRQRQREGEIDTGRLESWLRAADEARDAYAYWVRTRSRESYAVYRACADRADAAQDELARRDRGLFGVS